MNFTALGSVVAMLGLGFSTGTAKAEGFESQEIDSDVAIGYGVSLADIDGDGKTDIVLCDKNDIFWYRSPDWKKFNVVHKLTRLDHVCVDAVDVDGDGKAEIAAGAQWNPGDTLTSGSLHFLLPQKDRSLPWSPISLPNEPTIHRIRWIQGPFSQQQLLVVPLHGRGNQGGQGDGVLIETYSLPGDPESTWARQTVNKDLHMTHNVDPVQMDSDPEHEILICGREGIFLADWKGYTWTSSQLAGPEVGHGNFIGASEVRLGHFNDGQSYFATIEAFHGNNLVVYTQSSNSDGKYARSIITDDLSGGHAIVTGDFLGTGSHQIAVGWRNKNKSNTWGIRLYHSSDNGQTWEAHWVDNNGMAAEDIKAADMDGDGDIDLVAAGRASNNLRIYWNKLK